MGEESLEWLSSYLDSWLQYVVVGASSSTTRKMTKGAPQGGGMSPTLWRSYTNVIPEAGLKIVLEEDRENQDEPGTIIETRSDNGVVSKQIDAKVIASIGAVFDFYAGTVKRPGKFWIQLGLEWLPRLLREPRRLWRRNFVSTPLFLFYVLQEKLKKNY